MEWGFQCAPPRRWRCGANINIDTSHIIRPHSFESHLYNVIVYRFKWITCSLNSIPTSSHTRTTAKWLMKQQQEQKYKKKINFKGYSNLNSSHPTSYIIACKELPVILTFLHIIYLALIAQTPSSRTIMNKKKRWQIMSADGS